MKKYNVYRIIEAPKLDSIEDSYSLEVLQFVSWFDTEEEAISHINNLRESNESDREAFFTILLIY